MDWSFGAFEFDLDRVTALGNADVGRSAQVITSAGAGVITGVRSVNGDLSSEDVVVRLHRAMNAAFGLPTEDIDQVETLIRVGEHLVDFETLCTQICEYEITIGDELYSRTKRGWLCTRRGPIQHHL